MIRILGVSKSYKQNRVIENLSLEMGDGEIVALMGPSGCGKTTLLRIIAGLEKAYIGEVNMPSDSKISVVFQEDRLLETLTVHANVAAVLADTQSIANVDDILRHCGIYAERHHNPCELSGGMKRRVAIARAVAFEGDILLLDEPFKGLDDDTKTQVANYVFSRKTKLTLWVTHDEAEAKKYATKIIYFSGPPLVVTEQS